jgi:hypothetical protein
MADPTLEGRAGNEDIDTLPILPEELEDAARGDAADEVDAKKPEPTF